MGALYKPLYLGEGKERQRQSKARKNKVLVSIEDKRLFILFFFKTNPLQQVLPKKSSFRVKKSHSIKNVLLAAQNKRILYLSDTYEGNVHDKKIADEADIAFEKTIELLQDSGFQGYKPKNAIISQPVNKSRTKELTDRQLQ